MTATNYITLEDGSITTVNKKCDRIFGYHSDAKTHVDNLAYANAAEFTNDKQHAMLTDILINDPNGFNERFVFKPLSTLVEQLIKHDEKI